MLVLSAGSASELFAAACRAVLEGGTPVAPRGMATVEVIRASLCLTDPRRRLVDIPPTRVLNPAFAAAESVWILSGSDEPWIYLYNQQLTAYADNGRLMGAYGPRLRHWHNKVDQLDQVRQILATDPDSRRAVVQLFDPSADFHGYKDVPCTLCYRFFLRHGRLEMHTTMRSQDLWLGFCYDIFTATILQELLAGWLGVELGNYYHNVDSLHLYLRDVPEVGCLPAAVNPSPLMTPLAVPWETFDLLMSQVITGEPREEIGWAEITDVLASYRSWKAGSRESARRAAEQISGPLAEALRQWYHRLDQLHGAAIAETLDG